MKKHNARNAAFLVLISFSIFSYTYLSCVNLDTPSAIDSTTQLKGSQKENTMYVPDVTLTQKILQLGEKLLSPKIQP